MSMAKGNPTAQKAQKAIRNANARLIANHQAEYNAIYDAERISLGLPTINAAREAAAKKQQEYRERRLLKTAEFIASLTPEERADLAGLI